MKQQEYELVTARLIRIIWKLINGESVYVSDLANEFNVSTKTIQRDLKRLDFLGLKKVGRSYALNEPVDVSGLMIGNMVTVEQEM